MDDSVAAYCAAAAAGDMDRLMATLAPDAEVVSPLSGRMVFRGEDDVRHLLDAVYSTTKELVWENHVGDGKTRVAMADSRIGPLRLGDAMVFELAPDGLIRTVRPHLRPWLATTLFALLLGPKVGRRPGVIRRALTRA